MSFIEKIKKIEESIILEYYDGENIRVLDSKPLSEYNKESDNIRIAVLDVESTGFDVEKDEIIELAVKVIELNKHDGTNLKAIYKYESYNDPGFEISEEIINLTGIDNSKVKGINIDWNEVKEMLDKCQLLIAHNAKFDRKFIEKYIKTENVWSCSQNDINWKNRGFFKNSLELLCIWHGFHYGAHRAMNDVNATIHLITNPNYKEDLPITELINNAKKPLYRIINKFPYNEQHIKTIKSRKVNSNRYFWNPNNKSWDIYFDNKETTDEEIEWLNENIYSGNFKGMVQLISLFDRYKEF